MHFVQQITPFTCGLACIESVSFDMGKPITQCEMLKIYKDLLLISCPKREEFGSANTITLLRILNDIGFKTCRHKDHNPKAGYEVLSKLTDKQTAIICANFNNKADHCMRWVENKNQNIAFLMNPSFDLLSAKTEEISFDDLIKWSFEFIVITKP